MTWVERPGHDMTPAIGRALVAPGLEAGESLEHLAWGGELPTWDGVRSGLGKLAGRVAGEVRALKPADAVSLAFDLGGQIAVAELGRMIGVPEPENLLGSGDPTPPPRSTASGVLLAGTTRRLVLLEVHSIAVDGREGTRVFVAVAAASWWPRPVPAESSLRMVEERWFWRPMVALIYRDASGDRKLTFPEQPGFPDNLAEARAIAAGLR